MNNQSKVRELNWKCKKKYGPGKYAVWLISNLFFCFGKLEIFILFKDTSIWFFKMRIRWKTRDERTYLTIIWQPRPMAELDVCTVVRQQMAAYRFSEEKKSDEGERGRQDCRWRPRGQRAFPVFLAACSEADFMLSFLRQPQPSNGWRHGCTSLPLNTSLVLLLAEKRDVGHRRHSPQKLFGFLAMSPN